MLGQPHSYNRYCRERMYGFMTRHLLGQGNGEPIPEGDVQLLNETGPRLLDDREGAILPWSSRVVDIARGRAAASIANLPESRERVKEWVHNLVAAPEPNPT